MRALISVWDKTGLDGFVKGLASLGWELVASGGTAAYIEELGLEVTSVESLTEFPEMLGGRVKTLHPAIHAGILARRGVDEDLETIAKHGIEPIDLVCVNLYPFEQTAQSREADEKQVVEMIDVGGPALLRAAAKNYEHVIPVCRPVDYESILTEVRARDGDLSPDTRWRLASVAFATSAAYDASIARWFGETIEFPRVVHSRLREGHRPPVRREPAPGRRLLLRARRAHAPARAGRAAARPRALVQQPQRLERGAARGA